MKLQNKNNHKNVLIALAVALLVLGGGWLLVNRNSHKNLTTPTQTSGPTPQQQKQEADANAAAKEQLITGQNKADDSNTQPASSKTITLTAQQENNNTVTVFTKLQGYSDGSCSLVITNGSSTVNQTAIVAYQPEYSTCAGFSVPIGTVGKGTWTLKLSVTSNGTTESNTISYEVK